MPNLLIHESPPIEGCISRMSLGALASRRHRAKRERGSIGGSGVRERCGPSARHAGGTPALPDERSLYRLGTIFTDKQNPFRAGRFAVAP